MCIFDGMRTCATRKYKRLKLRSPQILFFCWTSVQFGVQSVVEELVCDPQIYSCWWWNSVSKSSISKTSLKNRDCEMIHNIMKSFLYICKNIAIYNPLISDIIPWYSITPCFFSEKKKPHVSSHLDRPRTSLWISRGWAAAAALPSLWSDGFLRNPGIDFHSSGCDLPLAGLMISSGIILPFIVIGDYFIIQERGIPFLTMIKWNDRGVLNTAHISLQQQSQQQQQQQQQQQHADTMGYIQHILDVFVWTCIYLYMFVWISWDIFRQYFVLFKK